MNHVLEFQTFFCNSISMDNDRNDLYYIKTADSLIIGGNGDSKNSAVMLTKNFAECYLGSSSTYGIENTIFSKTPRRNGQGNYLERFSCHDVEVWSFEE